jgi:hypothetical protein
MLLFVLFGYLLFYVLFVCKYVPPPGDNPIAVNKYINIKMKLNDIGCQDVEMIHLEREVNSNKPSGSRKCQRFFHKLRENTDHLLAILFCSVLTTVYVNCTH